MSKISELIPSPKFHKRLTAYGTHKYMIEWMMCHVWYETVSMVFYL